MKTLLIIICGMPLFFWGGNRNQTANPTLSPSPFTSAGHGAVTVTMSTSTAGANLRFTKNSTAPTYSSGTLISSSSGTATCGASKYTLLQVIAFIPGNPSSVSSVVSGEYDFTIDAGGGGDPPCGGAGQPPCS